MCAGEAQPVALQELTDATGNAVHALPHRAVLAPAPPPRQHCGYLGTTGDTANPTPSQCHSTTWSVAPGGMRPSSVLRHRLYDRARLGHTNYLQDVLRFRAERAMAQRHTQMQTSVGPTPLRQGHVVDTEAYGRGVVAWVGKLPGKKRTYVGVVLPEPIGNTNGTYPNPGECPSQGAAAPNPVSLFDCPAGHGVFVPRRQVQAVLVPALLPASGSPDPSPSDSALSQGGVLRSPLLMPLSPSVPRSLPQVSGPSEADWIAKSEERARRARERRLEKVQCIKAAAKKRDETTERNLEKRDHLRREKDQRCAEALKGKDQVVFGALRPAQVPGRAVAPRGCQRAACGPRWAASGLLGPEAGGAGAAPRIAPEQMPSLQKFVDRSHYLPFQRAGPADGGGGGVSSHV